MDSEAEGYYRQAKKESRELRKRINSRDFYELCQEYRHARVDAAPQFEALKAYLLEGTLPWPSYEE